jgi:hypothetical protein
VNGEHSKDAQPGAALGTRDEARAEREEMVTALTQARVTDPNLNAALLYLLLRGCNISTVEDPDNWSGERGRRAALALLDLPDGTVRAPGLPRLRRILDA